MPRNRCRCRRDLRGLDLRTQDDAVVLYLGLDPTLDLALGDAVQHLGVWRGGFGAEIPVFGSQIAYRVQGLTCP